MKTYRNLLAIITLAFCSAAVTAQVETGGVVRKRAEKEQQKTGAQTGPQVTERMTGFFETKEPHDADLAYMRQIYRQLDLTKDANTPLYFPEDVIDGQENLFRIILGLVVDEKIPAYEYLDGREVFTDQYRINVPEMLDRFGIYYTQGDGKGKKYVIEEADVPTGQVLNYYILEKWEFDRRTNRMKTRVEAICPVLNRVGDFGGEARYPMFWVRFDVLRPYLAQQYVFLNDDNNLPQYSLDDYFNLAMYDGEIYKTRNLRNLSMNQMYPDPDDLKRAQDSIDKRLREFGKDLWVPTREEYLAQREKAEEIAAAADSIPERTVVEAAADDDSSTKSVRGRRTKASSTKAKTNNKNNKKPKVKSAPSSSGNSANSAAAKSVRRRKK
ncbi:MAG: gliding motility protein GldN [Muribaculaceae bacterium]|nr:gliding motility protein GldN [Muribaculaceae bacterium]MDE7189168.1 gliding motility protein GldN [Muribaculaceae bacterium]